MRRAAARVMNMQRAYASTQALAAARVHAAVLMLTSGVYVPAADTNSAAPANSALLTTVRAAGSRSCDAALAALTSRPAWYVAFQSCALPCVYSTCTHRRHRADVVDAGRRGGACCQQAHQPGAAAELLLLEIQPVLFAHIQQLSHELLHRRAACTAAAAAYAAAAAVEAAQQLQQLLSSFFILSGSPPACQQGRQGAAADCMAAARCGASVERRRRPCYTARHAVVSMRGAATKQWWAHRSCQALHDAWRQTATSPPGRVHRLDGRPPPQLLQIKLHALSSHRSQKP